MWEICCVGAGGSFCNGSWECWAKVRQVTAYKGNSPETQETDDRQQFLGA